MRTLAVGICLLVTTTALVALAPVGESAGFCTNLTDEDCRAAFCYGQTQYGHWRTCTSDIILCVTEPCPGLP